MSDDTKRFFRPDGSIDMARALQAGRQARAGAARDGLTALTGGSRRAPEPPRRRLW